MSSNLKEMIQRLREEPRISQLRHYFKCYPLTLSCIAAICYLSLFFEAPRTSLDDVPFIDKWVHVCMYGGLGTLIWVEYLRRHIVLQPLRLCIGSILLPILMSALLEILQEVCTPDRNGDWLDLVANSVGVLIAAAMGYGVWRPFLHHLHT